LRPKTLVLGVGNPILGDDGVGISVARILREQLPELTDVEIEEASIGGLPLVESIIGYDTSFIIDATSLDGGQEGDIVTLDVDELGEALHTSNPHDLDFRTALSLVRSTGNKLPAIQIYGIRIKDEKVFSESLTPKIADAARVCSEMVLSEIKRMRNDAVERTHCGDLFAKVN
jgi:hydrogenase maturation protease